MNKIQLQLFELTGELEKRTNEYNLLCLELERFKRTGLDPNDSQYSQLAARFLDNYRAIKDINLQLKKLKKEKKNGFKI